MWAVAAQTPPLRALLARAGTLEQRMLRLYGVPESEIALSAARDRGATASRSTGSRSRPACAAARSRSRPSFEPAAAPAYEALVAGIRARHGDTLFSEDGATIDEQVARAASGRTIAVAESCTGGLMAGRLTDRAGSSAYVLGGVVVYSNAAKIGVRRRAGGADRAPRRGLPRGGGRARRRRRRALRRRRRRSASPGSRGPAAARAEKPVGMVCLSVAQAGGARLDRTVQLPGDRAMVRERTTTVVMHLLRRLLLAGPRPAEAAAVRRARRCRRGAVEALARFRDAAADPAVWRPLPRPGRSTSRSRSSGIGARTRRRPRGRCERARPFAAPRAGARRGAAAARRGGHACSPSRSTTRPAGSPRCRRRSPARSRRPGIYEPEARPFRPHVTVARLRTGARPPRTLAAAPEPLAFAGGAVDALPLAARARRRALRAARLASARLTRYSRSPMTAARATIAAAAPRAARPRRPADAQLRWHGCPEARGVRCATDPRAARPLRRRCPARCRCGSRA